jgi:DNA-binding MarR family transcriptional regulator
VTNAELAPDADPRNIGTLLISTHDVLERRILGEIAARGFHGVGTAQARIFEYLVVGGPATVTELAARVGVTKQAMAQTVARMAEQAYLTLEEHPSDRRARVVTISNRGWAVVSVADGVITSAQREWQEGLGARNWAQLRRLLLRLNALATNGAP